MDGLTKQMTADSRMSKSAAKILIVVTAGGKTNASPLLEIGEILAQRGYRLEFATLDGFQEFVEDLDWVKKTHVLGPGVSVETEEAEYLKMSRWEGNGWGPILETKQFLDSSWASVYPSLSAIMRDPENRPDFILSDYLVDASRDMFEEYGIPIALHWPQMPTMMMPASYIPGFAGLQVEVLTSEHATMRQRIKNELMPLMALPSVIKYNKWLKNMRLAGGVSRKLPALKKPNHLTLVNSFFGMEVPKDLPPNVVPIGPVLADTYPSLDGHTQLVSFLSNHKKVLYISLGTHVLLGDEKLRRILEGVIVARQMGWIDGVVWAIRGMARRQLDLDAPVPGTLEPRPTSVRALLDGAHEDFHFVEFAPQRAMLDHPSVAVFFTHGGASSTNEVAWHGARVIAMGVYFDQLQNMMRLRDAGVGIPLDKAKFTAPQLANAIGDLTNDREGKFAANTARVMKIARLASKRKHLAADKVEEVLAGGNDLHLQPADVRMPWWKLRNLDIWGVLGAGLLVTLALVIALPVALVKTL